MSAAIGLRDAGWSPVIVERATERRTGGYFVMLFDAGKEAAEKLGVLQSIGIEDRALRRNRTWGLDSSGNRHRSGGFLDDTKKPSGVIRSDIEAALWQSVQGTVEVRFGTVPISISEAGEEAIVVLRDMATGTETSEGFDLVIGADGLRSSVRQMVFGTHEEFMQSWDSIICAFQLSEQVPGFDDGDGIVAAEVDRSLWIFPFENHAPTALFSFRTKELEANFRDTPATTLRRVFEGLDHTAIHHALDQLEQTEFSLYDSVHQVVMPRWRKGRVLLLGDSAWCLTLYSGMGASSALRGGALLGEYLRNSPDGDAAALDRWEADMRAFVGKVIAPARFKYQIFVPSNHLTKFLRDMLLRVSGYFIGRSERRMAEKEADGAHHATKEVDCSKANV
ncbi:FAD-dependent monooxygenase [Paenarthrobacter nicotinovorans]|uniref:FAD-dependent monooxygenase n=1 Tax=Paenarthrobacter nicotinovorans TaxID=29320 RepID=UPI0037482791